MFRRKIDLDNVPKHIAFIMDGNGRWAKKRRMARTYGHQAGVNNLAKIVEECKNLGVKYVTIYAFSTENWKRPKDEIDTLFDLFREHFKTNTRDYKEKNIKVLTIGDLTKLPADLQDAAKEIKEATKDCDALTLVVAINYGARQEIVRAVNTILGSKSGAGSSANIGSSAVGQIDESEFAKHLWLDIPDPDLLVRTSGEMRLSNFLLWQVAYTEFYFATSHWPAFSKKHLHKAIYAYQKRNRRLGGL
ncbi:MAG: isoprenyl transferase [Firmicutes bacterium]|nr:isoprenyl transferase [Bacillota bacterium]